MPAEAGQPAAARPRAMLIEDLVQLVQEIERPLRVTNLDLAEWSSGPNDACLLGTLVLRCPSLTRLSLARNGLTDEAVFSLASCVRFVQESSGGALRELNLRSNLLSPDGCEAVARSFFPDAAILSEAEPSKPRGPYALDLSLNSGLGDAGAAALAIELKTQGCLGSLVLEGVGLCSAGFASLAVAADSLARLDLSRNAASSAMELAALFTALGAAPSLESLSFSDVMPPRTAGHEAAGSVSPDGFAELLAGALRCQESRIRHLAIAGNGLSGRSVQLVLEAARQGGGSLEHLDLDRNALGASWKGAESRSLVELITWHEQEPAKAPAEPAYWGLRSCSLAGNGLDDAAAALLAEGIRCSASLEVLRLSRNTIRDRGVECLADALKDQRAFLAELQEPLRRSTSPLTCCGDLAEARTVPRCSGVVELQLSRNPIGDRGLEALAEAASAAAEPSAPWGPWGLAELGVEGHGAGNKGQGALREAQKARVQLIQQLLRAISGQCPPTEGGGAPPTLLRVSGLPPLETDEVLLEADLARHWAEHYGLAAWPAQGENNGDEEFRLEQEVRMAVAEREEKNIVPPVDSVEVATREAPGLVTVVADECAESPSWLTRLGLRRDPNAPDALDDWYNEEEPAAKTSPGRKST